MLESINETIDKTVDEVLRAMESPIHEIGGPPITVHSRQVVKLMLVTAFAEVAKAAAHEARHEYMRGLCDYAQHVGHSALKMNNPFIRQRMDEWVPPSMRANPNDAGEVVSDVL